MTNQRLTSNSQREDIETSIRGIVRNIPDGNDSVYFAYSNWTDDYTPDGDVGGVSYAYGDSEDEDFQDIQYEADTNYGGFRAVRKIGYDKYEVDIDDGHEYKTFERNEDQTVRIVSNYVLGYLKKRHWSKMTVTEAKRVLRRSGYDVLKA